MSTDSGYKPEASKLFKDTERLAQDMRLLATMPDVYDVHFIVGKDKECVGGVKAILAARSRVFFNMLFGGQSVRTTDSGTPKKNNRKERNFAFLKRDSNTKTATPVTKCVTSIPIDDFEVDEFAHLMEFLHCGRCILDSRCIVGILAGADFFAVEDLQMAAFDFIGKCINVCNVCSFFCEAEKYIQLKSIKALVPMLLEFTATHAREVLGLESFRNLPQHVVRLILTRKDLNATEWEKFTAVLSWGHAYCEVHTNVSLQSAVEPLIDCIAFYKIPTMQLMQEVRKIDVVPDHVLMKALAYQADPMSVKLSKAKPLKERPSKLPQSPQKTDSSAKAHPNVECLTVKHQGEVVDVMLDHLTKG